MGAGLLAALLLAIGLLALPAALGALGDARSAEASLRQAEAALRDEDPDSARTHLAAARDRFRRAEDRLGSVLTAPARLVPGVRRQIVAARALSRAGVLVTEAGDGAVGALEARPPDGWKVQDGGIDLDALARAADALEGALPAAERAREVLAASPGTALAGPLARARADALRRVVDAEEGARDGLAGLRAAPELLGGNGPRRYFLGLGHLGELRGTGGFLGLFTVLETEGGRIRLVEEAGRPAADLEDPGTRDIDAPDWVYDAYTRYGALEIWQNVNMPTDFPTVGSIVRQSVPADLEPIHGFMQLDPLGLAEMLRPVGSVTVDAWPEPITAGNVSQITQFDAELRFGDDNAARIAFLKDLIDTVFRRLTDGEIPLDAETLSGLGDAVRGGHIQLWSTNPEAQAALDRTGLSRALARTADATDIVGLVTHNATGNKADWFLRRDIAYRATLDPRTDAVTGHLEVDVRNTAPSSGLPSRVIGSATPEVMAGTNRQILVLLRHPDDEMQRIIIGDRETPLSRDREGELRAYHGSISARAESSVLVEGDFIVPGGLSGSGRDRTYRLHVLRQPTAFPDTLSVEVDVPRGWTAAGPVRIEGPLDEDVVLEVPLRQSFRAWVVETTVLRPWRLARDLLNLG